MLESSHYLRNQLLRDADWAGMGHSIEIRVPLVDIGALESLAPAIGHLTPGEGKAALASSPSIPLPGDIAVRRAWRRRVSQPRAQRTYLAGVGASGAAERNRYEPKFEG